MSEFLDPDTGDEQDGDGTRRHALWGLIVLGCIALLVAALMVFLGGGGGHKNNQGLLDVPVQTPHHSATPSATRGTTGVARSSSTPATATTTPTAPRTGNPCSHGSSCVVEGDGGAIAAVNALRAKHGLGKVPGSVTANAQTCALHNGGGSTCVPHYAWTSVPAQDGQQAIAKIADFAEAWMLDAKMSSLGVGWAYVGGSYECVLLKSP